MRSRPTQGTNAVLLWLPPLVWAGVLFVLSSGNPPPIAPPLPYIDKVQHAIAFAVLGFLVARALAGTTRMSALGVVAFGGLAAALYGVSDEVHQSFTPGRFVEAGDAVADTVGGFAGAGLSARCSAFGLCARSPLRWLATWSRRRGG